MVKQSAADPRRLLAILGLLLAACSGPASSPSEPAHTRSPAPSSTTVANASPSARSSPVERTAKVIASIPLGQGGTEMAAGTDSVWVRLLDGSVARIDPRTNTVVATIPIGRGEFGSVALGDRAVWVTTFDENKLSRIDPATNRVVAEITPGTNPGAILATPGAIWVSNHRGGSVSRVDPATNNVVATISIGPAKASGPASIRLVGTDLWVAVPNISKVVRIDPATNEPIASVTVPGLFGLLDGGDALYAYGIRDQLYEIATDTNAVARKFAPEHVPWTYGAGSFWGSDGKDLIRFEGAPFDSFERWHVAGDQTGYADFVIADGSMWLPTDDGSLMRIGLPS